MNDKKDFPWIAVARSLIGLKEIKGPQHAPEILQMWKDIKRSGIKDDETPWCAAFVGAMLERVGIKSSRFEGARSYEQWGDKLNEPVYGCVAVLTRTGGGHVAFVVGEHSNGDLLLLGGNQGDSVSIARYPRSRVSAYRWPTGVPLKVVPMPIGEAAYSPKDD